MGDSEGTPNEPEKPVPTADVFPPFPEPADADFDEDINLEEREYYKNKLLDLNHVKSYRLHCTACDRHLGCSAKNESRMRAHPMLRTLVCHTCHTFYNSGEFDKGDDGSELYCRWCGQGGQVYCCSDCPHVFCAKCIKRNLGMAKIKEIENTDDWKCFKCNPRCLWDLRALCWALLRYCDLKNKITYTTHDPRLKEIYQKDCAEDHSECCKNKPKRRSKDDSKKKDEKKDTDNKKSTTSAIISKIPPTIQVKKFASMIDDTVKPEKKAQKRPASPKMKPIYIKSPINLAPGPGPAQLMNPMAMPGPASKKIRMSNPNFLHPVRFSNVEKKSPMATYGRTKPPNIRPTQIQMPILTNHFNGFNNLNTFYNDNINLSLESLTQGLDMSTVTSIDNNGFQNDVVCTPDFPLEPLCEVTEDNADDDVQCITPGPVVAPKVNTNTPPPLIARTQAILPEGSSDNIIQMTENDVTVNAATGGLKFRVDPQTLSSNKMYRLPDGRIFAINANPAMPGGYSATIVAVTENVPGKVAPKGPTYAAKLSAVSSQNTSTPVSKLNRSNTRAASNTKTRSPKSTKIIKITNTSSRTCDVDVPVEWFRYNLLDAVDSLEYSLSRLQKLKREATSMHLRTRTIHEMKNIHKTFDRLLHTSSTRFNEIRQNLNKEMKQYITKKTKDTNVSEDDDDVEILNDANDNDDPIYIDENSVDSNVNDANCNDVDLTIVSSDHNESGENKNSADNSKSDENLTFTNYNKNVNHGNVSETTHTAAIENEKPDEGNDDEENIQVPENKTSEKTEDENTDCEENDKVDLSDKTEIETTSKETTNVENEKEGCLKDDTHIKNEETKTTNVENEKEGCLKDDTHIKNEETTDNDEVSGSTQNDDDVEMENKRKITSEENKDNNSEKENNSDVNIKSDQELNDVHMDENAQEDKEDEEEKELLDDDRTDVNKDCSKDTEMSDEMIENLLNEETNKDEILGT